MFEGNTDFRTIAVVTILTLGLCARSSLARAQGVVGKITQVTPKAQKKSGTSTVEAAAGMPVELQDQLTTGSPGEITLQLTDNSVLTVNESSVLMIDESVVGGAGTTKVDLVSGSVRSVVNAVARRTAGPKFEVVTPNAIAGVRGTDFTCRHYRGPAIAGFPNCFEFTECATSKDSTGSVVVTNNPPKPLAEVVVRPGYVTLIPCGFAPLAPMQGTLGAFSTATAGAATFTTPVIAGAGLLTAGVIAGTTAAVVETTGGGTSTPAR